ncbi:MAG: cytochrome C oxidase assembly protein, partial [Sulfurospirillum sp.]
GYRYEPSSKIVSIEAMKYLHNFLDMPIVAGMLIIGALMLILGIVLSLFSKNDKGIWPSGLGTVLVVISLFFVLGYNHTAYYPSLVDMQSSLNIENSSGSHYTLKTMAYVSLLVPFVLGYIIIVWRAMNREKITVDEVKNDPHHY